MSHTEKLEWMREWCKAQNLALDLEGECGFARECVGVASQLVNFEFNCYPDYEWFDTTHCTRLDPNGDVWTPADAYHKHTCVAVLGRGEDAEVQLYEWLKWFHTNGFVYECVDVECTNQFELLLGRNKHHRMIKKETH